MLDKTILRIAFAASIIGICTLFIISRMLDGYQTDIFLADDGSELRLRGEVQDIVRSNGVIRVSILLTEPIDAVLFDDGQEASLLMVGQTFTFYGEKSEYEGNPELVITRIT